jgi:hypothetical protein
MNRFIPHILSIQTAKFSSKIYLIPRILSICTYSFRIFSVFEQIHSSILSMRSDSFPVLGECAQIILNIRNVIIFVTAFKGILLQKKVFVCATRPKTYKE